MTAGSVYGPHVLIPRAKFFGHPRVAGSIDYPNRRDHFSHIAVPGYVICFMRQRDAALMEIEISGKVIAAANSLERSDINTNAEVDDWGELGEHS